MKKTKPKEPNEPNWKHGATGGFDPQGIGG
jgi:hypothetical protein